MKNKIKGNLFTGIQPTGELHLGNYFGAVKPFINLELSFTGLVCIANLHSLTVPQTGLKNKTLRLAKTLMACGIKSDIFVQSDVPEHSQLCQILSCYVRMGELERMTQFKVKQLNQPRENLGLFSYPVLMAADILLYDTHFVPVGHDQIQHLELAILLAKRFNKLFPNTFTVPAGVVEDTRILSLTTPEFKMSKSDPNPKGVLYLTDTFEVIQKKIKSARTTAGKIDYSDEGVKNLLNIRKQLGFGDEEFLGGSYSELKDDILSRLFLLTGSITNSMESITDNDVQNRLEEGRIYARSRASETMEKVYTVLEL